MRLKEAVVLAANTNVADVHRRLAGMDATALVVVRREQDGQTYHYVFRAGQVMAATSAGGGPSLTEALDLREWQASPTADLHEPPAPRDLRGPIVLLDGDVVVGVMVPDSGGVRGTSGDVGSGGVRGGRGPSGGTGKAPPPTPAPPTAQPPAPPSDLFHAFPRVEAPDAVVSETPFDIQIGFAAQGAPGATAVTARIDASTPNEPVPFVVQVMGFGFDFPEGVSADLHVPRGRVDQGVAVIKAIAQPVSTDVVRVIEVSYEFEGNVVGRAWREVNVGAQQPPAPTAAPLVGGTGVTPPDELAPHMTVEIRSRQGDAEVEWLLHTRYTDLPRPTKRLTTELDEGSAKEFAIQIIAQLPAQQGSPFLRKTVIGIGRRVSAAMPTELWTLLGQVWERAHQAAEVPSLLLVTNEAYVPWELAWVDEDYADASLLPTPAAGQDPGQSLGSLWQIGRWVPPIARTPRGGDRPPMPPSTTIDITSMAVVIGDYASDTSQRPLPEAVEEGKQIALQYQGFPLKADEADINRLLSNDLSRNNQPFEPTAVHIAAHGEVSPQMQQYSGIILGQTQRRLDPLVVQGSSLTRDTKPFVFLNACQVGTAGAFLSEYGGMPGAFLTEGCRGYVAPLWNVDDVVARRFAVEFYDAALGAGTPVAECLRLLRNKFGTDWDGQTATPLAYVFYGHPSLVLKRSSAASTATNTRKSRSRRRS